MAKLMWDDSSVPGDTVTYGSTNRWLRFAFAWWEQDESLEVDGDHREFFPDIVSIPHRYSDTKWTASLDHLLPLELRDLDHRPARAAMRRWASRFFAKQTAASGLIPSGLGSNTVPAVASFEDGITGWTSSSNGNLFRDDDHARWGQHSLRLEVTGPGDASVSTTHPHQAMPVRAGVKYTASISVWHDVWPDPTQDRPFRVEITWLNKDGEFLAVSEGSRIEVTPPPDPDPARSDWPRVHVTATAPEDRTVAFAALTVNVLGAAADDVWYFDGALFAAGTSTDYYKRGTVHYLWTLRRMADFVGWFGATLPAPLPGEPDNPDWPEVCERWATGVFDPRPGTHRVPMTTSAGTEWRWHLYDAVDTSERDLGVYHERNTKISDHGTAARALEHLARVVPDGGFERLARNLSWQMWQDNPRPDLVSDWVSIAGQGYLWDDSEIPACHDKDADGRCTSDTDCLYWARTMYRLYEEAGGPTGPHPQHPAVFPRLVPSTRRGSPALPFEQEHRLAQIRIRREQLDQLLDDRPGVEELDLGVRRYLFMALTFTLEWLRRGWIDQADHSARKVYWDAIDHPDDRIYGDGMWNTLYVLVDAYRFTGDDFYLDYLRQAWAAYKLAADRQVDTWELVVEGLPLARRMELRNFLESRSQYVSGDLTDNRWRIKVPDRRGLIHPMVGTGLDRGRKLVEQDCFIDVLARAHDSLRRRNRRDDWYLRRAEQLADLAISKFDRQDLKQLLDANRIRPHLIQNIYPTVVFSDTFTPVALLRLALARGTLHRLVFSVPVGSDVEFSFFGPPEQNTTPAESFSIHAEGSLLVVYMDEGCYGVTVRRSSGAETHHYITVDCYKIVLDRGPLAWQLSIVSETNPLPFD